MSIARVGIVGSGIMGSGISETAAVSGFEVVLRSRSQSTANATIAALEKSLNRQIEKGKKTEAERDEALARVTGTSDLAALKDVDLVIESVVEDLAVKKELFNELDRITSDHTILATNTSTLPVIELAMQTGRPDRVCGVHTRWVCGQASRQVGMRDMGRHVKHKKKTNEYQCTVIKA